MMMTMRWNISVEDPLPKDKTRKRYCNTGNDVHHTYNQTYTK
jgi:hypothetical protein